jgi:hypothetical protein
MPDRSIGTSTLLPVTASKDRDGKTKEENLKLLNGNSLDSLDLVCECAAYIVNNPICYQFNKWAKADLSFLYCAETKNSNEREEYGEWERP